MNLAQQFYDLFKGQTRAHGEFTIDKVQTSQKIKGKGRTVYEPYNAALWEKHLNGEAGLGVVPIMDDNKCWWGCVDIDIKDERGEFRTIDFNKLNADIQKYKMPLFIARSKSNGAHLYIFFKEAIEAVLVKSKLLEWTVLLGYSRNTEIFPKQGRIASSTDVGSWLNMPYFNDTNHPRYGLSPDLKDLTAQEFIYRAESLKITKKEFKKWELGASNEMLSDGPPCLQILCRDGVPEGTRNNALLSFGVYCKKKYSDNWKEELSKINHEVLDKPLPAAEEANIQKSLERKDYFYKCKDTPIAEICNKAVCLTRKYGIGTCGNPGVVIEHLTKINSDPPTWYVTIEGTKIQIEDTETLIQFQKFKVFCMEKLNILPFAVKTEIWDAAIRELLQRVEIQEAPEYLTDKGMVTAWVQDFCETRMVGATDFEDILKDKVYYNPELQAYFFKPALFYKYVIQKSPTKPMSKNKLFAIITHDLGGTKTVRKIKGKSEEVFKIPSDKVSIQTEDFTAKVTKEEF
jgi:hypothetical protein